jgi:hypothetical protein
MDMTTLAPFIALAVGGAIGGNILGAATRGGGVVGRTILGAMGGVGAAFVAGEIESLGQVTALWSDLIEGEIGVHVAELITGAAGGGVMGLILGVLVRPRP